MLCKFCGKERKNQNSLRNHERLCKDNPNRQSTPFHSLEFQKNRKAGNQFTKAKELGLTPPVVSAETRAAMSRGVSSRSPEFNAENGKKASKTINEKVAAGKWHTSLAKKLHQVYAGESFHSTWEVAYAKFLDSVGTPWDRNTRSFEYEFGGKTRRYTPDFYLPIEDVYVEIKGYKTEVDEAKWAQFPERLVVLMEEDLRRMQVI